jgi:hypothetical protein
VVGDDTPPPPHLPVFLVIFGLARDV